ncbi:MAG: MASE3 domain-containing protein [Dehalococcoidales bacterium]|nr:MASE3 domain-containing protein [Dehalococcoidales bacterium]
MGEAVTANQPAGPAKTKPANTKILISIIISIIGLAAFYMLSRVNYLLFHSLAEVFSVAIAWGVFVFAWNSRRLLDNGYLLFIGIAYLFIGGMDFIHTLAFRGMGVFSADYGTNLATQLWITTRYLQAISLLAAPLFIRRKLNLTPVMLAYTLAVAVLLASIFGGYFPRAFIEGVGLTPFKIISEYIISFILLGAIWLTVRNRGAFGQNVAKYLVTAMVITIVSEMAFTLYADAYGIAGMLGHLLKIISFGLIYQAFIVTGLTRPSELVYNRLSQSEQKFRHLFVNMTEGFALHDIITDENGEAKDYRIMDINPAYEAITGLKREQVIGKKASELYGTGQPPYLDVYAGVAKGGLPADFETYFPPMGKHFKISVFSPQTGQFATVFTDVTGTKQAEEALKIEREALEKRVRERTYALTETNAALQIEIDERKRAEKAVNAERQRFNEVLDMLPAYVVLLAPDYHVPFANKFFRERFGESYGKRCFEYLFGRSEACENCESYKAMKTNSPHHWEWTGPDGHNYDIYDFPFTDVDGSHLIMEMGIDITEQKKAQQALSKSRDELELRVRERTGELRATMDALRESEDQYRRIVETAQEGIWITEPDGKILLVNRRMAEMLGYSREEMPGRIGAEYFAEGQGDIIAKARADYRAGKNISVECRLRHKDGRVIWVIVNGTPLHDENGIHTSNLALFTDITKHKENEQALEETRDYLENLLNYANAPIIVWDPQLRITRFNHAFERLTGLSTVEAINKKLDILFPEESREQSLQLIHKTAAGERWEVVEIPIKHKDGTVRTVLWNSATLFGADEKTVIATIAQGQDITERKEVEEALIHEKNLTDSTIDALPGVFYLFDDKERFLRWNKNFEVVTGYSAEEIRQISPVDLFEGQDKESVGVTIGNVFSRGESSVEAVFVSKDGRKTPYFFTGKRIKLGQVSCLVGMGIDITERKEAEQALKLRSEELSRSNAELEQFAYIASHDLQEPLRMVSSYVQLLGKRYEGKLDSDADEFINYARDGAARMQRLITDLLAYSRVGTRGKEFEEMELEIALANALDNLKVVINDKRATITHDPLPRVFADSGQITQVFQNLIDNAIKYQGSEPPRIHVSVKVNGDECICSVKDNGIGIAPEYHTKLFLLFQRLHTKREYPGTGIGLAVCKRIIERHGGRIWVESQPGAGSTFYFTLPLKMKRG